MTEPFQDSSPFKDLNRNNGMQFSQAPDPANPAPRINNQFQKNPVSVRDEAPPKIGGQDAGRPANALEAYMAERLATDPNYVRELQKGHGKGGIGYGFGAAITDAIRAKYINQYRNEWKNLADDQRADKTNAYIENGTLDKNSSVNTSRIDAFRAKNEKANAMNPQKPEASVQDMLTNRKNAGLTAGANTGDVNRNRSILQDMADKRNSSGYPSQTGSVTKVETNTPSFNITTNAPTGIRTPDASALVAKNNALAQDAYDNQGQEFRGDASFQPMAGSDFNAMQKREGTKTTPAQSTNEQNVLAKRDKNGVLQIKASMSPSGSKAGDPMVTSGNQSGTINGVPGKQAIGDQINSNKYDSLVANKKLKPGSPVSDMINQGSDMSPNPFTAISSPQKPAVDTSEDQALKSGKKYAFNPTKP